MDRAQPPGGRATILSSRSRCCWSRGASSAAIGWYRFFREEPQPDGSTPRRTMRFKYGSIGAEATPASRTGSSTCCRACFPTSCPGPAATPRSASRGSRARNCRSASPRRPSAFRASRTTARCCHTSLLPRRARTKYPPSSTPDRRTPSTSSRVLPLPRRCARRIRASTPTCSCARSSSSTELDWIDRLAYRFAIIPITQQAPAGARGAVRLDLSPGLSRLGPRPRRRHESHQVFHDQGAHGRHVRALPTCPSMWNLKKYDRAGDFMNLAGDSHDSYSVIIDSAFGLLAAPPKSKRFLEQVKWMHDYLSKTAPPEVSLFDRPTERAMPERRSSNRIARAAMRVTRTGTACPSPMSAPTANGSTPGTRPTPSPRTRWCGRWGSSGRVWSRRISTVTSFHFSTGSGCGRPICTTGRCRRCATC